MGGPADRLPAGRAGPAGLRAARVPAQRGVLLVHLLADPGPLSLRAGRAAGVVPGGQARHDGDPVEAWAEITGNPGLARRYQSARGKGGFVRASWDEAVELAAAAHVHTIRTWGPDRIAGFSPIPAMSMVSHAAGARFHALIGAPMLSFYDWYADLPVASPQVFGDQTDVPESGDWWDASYLVLWGLQRGKTQRAADHDSGKDGLDYGHRRCGRPGTILEPDSHGYQGSPPWLLRIRDGHRHHLDRHVPAGTVLAIEGAARCRVDRARRAQHCAGGPAGRLPLQRGGRHSGAGASVRLLHDRGRDRRARGAARGRGSSAGHGDPGRPGCCRVARADLRRACQPAAHPGAQLGPRRRQRHLAAVGGRHAVPLGRGIGPGSRLALAIRAAGAGRRRAVERRAGAVPAARLTDLAAVADSCHDPRHPRARPTGSSWAPRRSPSWQAPGS